MKGSIVTNPYVIIVGNLFLLSRDKSLRKKEREERVSHIITHLIDVEMGHPICKTKMIPEWVHTGVIMDWAVHDSDVSKYNSQPFIDTKGMKFSLSLMGTVAYETEGNRTYKDSITIGYLEMMDYLRHIMYLVNSSTIDRSKCHRCDYYNASALEARVRFNIMEVINDTYDAMFCAIQ